MAVDALGVLSQAQEAMTVRRVFGEPFEKDGIAVIPVAAVRGGGGGGGGTGPDEQGGSGGGFGLTARPVGAYVVSGGEVTWHPALDVTRVVLGGQLVAVLLAFMARSIVRAARR
jgi:uncharacterized spore protein YtfJ